MDDVIIQMKVASMNIRNRKCLQLAANKVVLLFEQLPPFSGLITKVLVDSRLHQIQSNPDLRAIQIQWQNMVKEIQVGSPMADSWVPCISVKSLSSVNLIRLSSAAVHL